MLFVSPLTVFINQTSNLYNTHSMFKVIKVPAGNSIVPRTWPCLKYKCNNNVCDNNNNNNNEARAQPEFRERLQPRLQWTLPCSRSRGSYQTSPFFSKSSSKITSVNIVPQPRRTKAPPLQKPGRQVLLRSEASSRPSRATSSRSCEHPSVVCSNVANLVHANIR